VPSAGDFVRASDIPGDVGCRLRRVANQSISSGVTTSVSWDTEDVDTSGFIAVTSTTITIPTGLDGLYAITYDARGPGISGAAGTAAILILPTSAITGMPADFTVAMDASLLKRASLGITIPLLAADSFVCQVRHGTGSAQNFTAWLSCYRIAVL
jgi:hypothetical protein